MASKQMTTEEYFKKVNKEDQASILVLKNQKPLDFIPTGSWVLDQIIGDGTMTGKPGGFPRGHIVELFGDESTGKTTIALSAIVKAQEMNEIGVLMDFEQTFHKGYAEKIGIDTDPKKFVVTQPMHFQQGARQIKDIMINLRPAIIVVDSIAAMIPREYLEGEVDDAARVGLHANLMSKFCALISKYVKASNTCLLFTNQLRSVIKKNKYQSGPDEETTGGRAFRYYTSLRVKLRKSTVEHVDVQSKITGKKEKEPINVTVKAQVAKSKIDLPYRAAPIYIRFGEGIDNILSMIELGTNIGIIKKSGTFLSIYQNDQLVVRKQGKEQLWRALNEDEKLFDLLQSSLVIEEDKETKDEFIAVNESDDMALPPDEMDAMLDDVAKNFIDKRKKKMKKKEIEEEAKEDLIEDINEDLAEDSVE